MNPSVPFVPRYVELPKKFLVKSSADGLWLLIVPDNSLDWKVLCRMDLVKEALRLSGFSAFAYTTWEGKS